ALSPPRLCYKAFAAGPRGAEFLDTYARAQRLVEQDRPAELLEVRMPLPMIITAAGDLEKYGPGEWYDYVRFVGGAGWPALVTLGGLEVRGNVAFQGTPEELARLGPRHPHLRTEVVGGADHFYSAARPELLERIEAWLRSVGGGP